MKRSVLWVVLSLVSLGAAAACSSSSTGSTPPPATSCLAQVGATGALVYPAQSATGVPDNVGQVIIGTTTTLPSSWNVELFFTSGFLAAIGGSVTPAPNPLPTPNTIPPFANPVYQSSAMPVLPAGTTFQVGVNNTASTCLPTIVGVFTTQ